MTQGIYEIKINEVRYIGKDSNIHQNKRYNHHLSLLKNGKHFNKHLQRAYNKYKEIHYDVLIEFDEVDEETLNKAEMFYIDLFETFDKGFNQTKGGDGTKGRTPTQEEVERMRNTRLEGIKNGVYKLTNGEVNGMNKLTEFQVKEIIDLFYQMKLSDFEIAEKYDVNRSTINAIYNGARWSYLKEVRDWLNFKEQNKHKFRKQGFNTLLPVEIYEIKHLLKYGLKTSEIVSLYNTSPMTISRINNQKAYQEIDMNMPYSYYKI